MFINKELTRHFHADGAKRRATGEMRRKALKEKL